MSNNWKIILSTPDRFRAEMAKGILDEHGIDSVIINKKDASYLFGELDLNVKADDFVKAKYLLKDLEH